MNTLNEQQRRCAEFDGGHLLVLAGAGTGKTRTIIARARFLISNGIDTSKILILSFTRKSAREIVARINSATSLGSGKQLKGSTFHSWCREIIASNPQIFPNASYSMLDEEDVAGCFSLICGKLFKKENHISPDELREVYSFMVNTRCSLSDAITQKIFNSNESPEAKKLISEKRGIFENVIKKYIAYKREHHYLDYDDLLSSVAMAMKKSPEVRQFIAAHYRHILVDEMQDTNPLQYLLLEQFAPHCSLFCVGDDAQSIYAFRGADFKTIHNFSDRFPGAQVKKLTINYRSSQEILNLSNWVLHKSPLHYDKYLQAASGKSGILPQIIHYEEEIEEAEDIVARIKDSCSDSQTSYSDQMVISRSIYGLRSVEACLIEAGIPYKLFGGTSIMQSAHVRDVVSAMRILSNHRDELAWMRFLCLWPGIGERKAAKLIEELKGQDTFAGTLMKMEAKNLAHPEQLQFLRTLAQHTQRPDETLNTALQGLEHILAAKYKEDWNSRKEDFTPLSQVAAHAQSISAFIQEYVLDPKAETGLKSAAETSNNAVTLTTIHQAKGLEAKHVYIVDVSWSKYPNVKAISRGADAIEEERRCLYVALTRAKTHLILYRTTKAMRVENPLNPDSQDSYFLNHLPNDLVEMKVIHHNHSQWNTFTGKKLSDDDLIDDLDFS